MVLINLLPWREQQREQQKRGFIRLLLSSSVILVCGLLLTHLWLNTQLSNQNYRNQRLSKEISSLDFKITEITKMKTLRQSFQERITIIRDLQKNRSLPVHLFDEITANVPRGIFLTKLQRVKNEVQIEGMAESNTNISEFMRSLEHTHWLKEATLIQIKREFYQKKEYSSFQLKLLLEMKDSDHG